MTHDASYPLISIAMATYNGGKYLEQQLDSIYAQTYPNIEVVVCDDGSTDNTAEILNRYVAEKGLQFYPNPERLGYIKNFERAMNFCKGEFIALSDQDDIWAPNKVEYLYQHIGDNLLIHGTAEVINSKNETVHPSDRKMLFGHSYESVYLNDHNYRRFLMTRDSLCRGCTFLMHRDLLTMSLPIPDFEKSHDLWLAFVAASQKRQQYIEVPLISWRLHNDNTTQAAMSDLEKHKYKKFFVGSPIHYFYRRLRYYKRSNVLKNRGIKVEPYPVKSHEEMY